MSKPPPWTRRAAVKKFYHDWCDTLEYEQAMEDSERMDEHPGVQMGRSPAERELTFREHRYYWGHPVLWDSDNPEADAVWMAERNNTHPLACLVMQKCASKFSPRTAELIWQILTGTFKAGPGKPPELTPYQRRQRSWLPDAEWECQRAESFLTERYPKEAAEGLVKPLALELALERMERMRVMFGIKGMPAITEQMLTNFMRRPANDRRRFVANPRNPQKTKP